MKVGGREVVARTLTFNESQLVRNTVRRFGKIQLTMFEKYSKRSDPDCCDRHAEDKDRGIGHSSNWMITYHMVDRYTLLYSLD